MAVMWLQRQIVPGQYGRNGVIETNTAVMWLQRQIVPGQYGRNGVIETNTARPLWS